MKSAMFLSLAIGKNKIFGFLSLRTIWKSLDTSANSNTPRYNLDKKIIFVIIASLLIFSVTLFPESSATPAFSSSINLSSDGISSNPSIATSGSNVFVVWEDTATDVRIRKSSNNGASFAAEQNLSNSGSAITPSIAASGSVVHVVWEEGGTIKYSKSTTSGDSFVAQTDPGSGSLPKVVASGSNVYIIWESSGNIVGVASSNDGSSFSSQVNLSDTATPVTTTAQVAASGTSAFVVWRSTTAGAGDVFFSSLSNSGSDIAPVNLSSNTGSSQVPMITSSGSTAYVVWRDDTPSGSNGDVLFSTISNAGTIGIDKTNLSSNAGTSTNPKVAVDGTDVYVVWEDNLTSSTAINYDIFLKYSSNSGSSFGSQVNVSNTNGVSTTPAVSASGNNVDIVWRDTTVANGDVFFKTSPDKTTSFGGLVNLSSDTATSQSPRVVTTSTYTYTAWHRASASDVFFRGAAISAVDVKLNAIHYNIGDTATITATDSNANTNAGTADTLTVTVSAINTSFTSVSSFTRVLTETGVNTGVFSGQVTLGTGATSSNGCTSSCQLQVASGNMVTAAHSNGITTIGFMPSRTLAFGFSSYTLSDGRVGGTAVQVTLTDSTANTDSNTVQSVDITVTSTTQSSGITLQLEETGANTGIFKNTNLIFMRGANTYSIGDSVTISAQLASPAAGVDTIPANIKSTTSSGGFDLTLTETSANTGLVTGTLQFSSTGPSGGSTIQVSAGDIVSIQYNNGGIYTNGIVSPNSNSKIGAIRAASGDTITASYLGTTGTATISSDPLPGGGGGGVSSATVVVNALAPLLVHGSGSSGSAPLVGTATLNSLGNPSEGLIGKIGNSELSTSSSSTKIAQPGEKLVLKMDIASNEGIQYITHAELGVNNKGDRNIASDTSIIYDKFNPQQVRIVDPHGLFKDASFKIIEKDAKTGFLQFELTFAKPMEKSDVRLLAWDVKRNFVQQIYDDALKVEGTPQAVVKSELPTKTSLIQEKKPVPQKIIKQQKESENSKNAEKQFENLVKMKAKEKQSKKLLVAKMQNTKR